MSKKIIALSLLISIITFNLRALSQYRDLPAHTHNAVVYLQSAAIFADVERGVLEKNLELLSDVSSRDVSQLNDEQRAIFAEIKHSYREKGKIAQAVVHFENFYASEFGGYMQLSAINKFSPALMVRLQLSLNRMLLMISALQRNRFAAVLLTRELSIELEILELQIERLRASISLEWDNVLEAYENKPVRDKLKSPFEGLKNPYNLSKGAAVANLGYIASRIATLQREWNTTQLNKSAPSMRACLNLFAI